MRKVTLNRKSAFLKIGEFGQKVEDTFKKAEDASSVYSSQTDVRRGAHAFFLARMETHVTKLFLVEQNFLGLRTLRLDAHLPEHAQALVTFVFR